MPSFKPKALWEAEPHTLAKIEIVRQYLVRWFQILGRAHPNRRLLYIDGFSGPGEYLNAVLGSPVTALNVAREAIQTTPDLRNKEIVFLFVEKEAWCVDHLRSVIQRSEWPHQIKWDILHGTFDERISSILSQIRAQGQKLAPTFAFIDPFGATGLPFRVIAEIVSYPSCEVLLNLDADGVGRLFKASDVEANRNHLTETFGGDCWQRELNPDAPMTAICSQVLALYKTNLRALHNVRYVFPFSMADRHGRLIYHLVFASQHHKGLEKMKEAMRSVDKSGSYSFSDASAGQDLLPFNFDDPTPWGARMQRALGGEWRSYQEFNDFALNETPFLNPKQMLAELKKRGSVEVRWRGQPAKSGFPEEKITHILIKREADKLI